ncbi:hypothetical protein QVD17_01658 [Tagetes erecta]|uniref:PB1-like domain-containing protein n=1 Tax=Tagetes erecta TaxID=13708 RepID=A0AAD8P8G7_TARER|nr:hypothetical protein QVD17_01658 [Tagetes erecta]
MVVIRSESDEADYTDFYDIYPEYFSIKLHHGGEFRVLDHHNVYVKGKVNYVDLINPDKFCVFDLNDIVVELGYDKKAIYYYHYLVPGGDLDFGLRALGNDADILHFMEDIKDNKCISVYIEHGKTRLITYFVSPTKTKLVLKEIEKGDTSVHVVTKRLLLDWNSKHVNQEHFEGDNMGSSAKQPEHVNQEHFESLNGGMQRNWIDEMLFDDMVFDYENEHMVNDVHETVGNEGETGNEDETGNGDETNGNEDETSNEDETGNRDEACNGDETGNVQQTGNVDDDVIVDEQNKIDEVDVDMEHFKVYFDENNGIEINENEEEDYLSNDSFETCSSDGECGFEKLRRKALRKLKNQQKSCTFFVKTNK